MPPEPESRPLVISNLLRSLIRGTKECYKALIKLTEIYTPKLERIVDQRLKRISDEDKKDIVSYVRCVLCKFFEEPTEESKEKLEEWEKLNDLSLKNRCDAWLFTVLNNEIKNFLKKPNEVGRCPPEQISNCDYLEELLDENAKKAFEIGISDKVPYSPQDILERSLKEAKSLLSKPDRTIIDSRIKEKQPFGEIAKELGITENTARKRFERSLKALREIEKRMLRKVLKQIPPSDFFTREIIENFLNLLEN